MNLKDQIKKYRTKFGYSQEELADRIFVTRQSVSNWENGKNYPDVNSLILLSNLFKISLDTLVKGDLETMNDLIKKNDHKKFNLISIIFTSLTILMIVSAAPLFIYLGKQGVFIWVIIAAITIGFSLYIEKQKKIYNIQTFKEILAFINGEIPEDKPSIGKKDFHKKLASGFVLGIIAFLITYLISSFIS